MKLAQSVKIGAWLLIALNLLMRMAPAIKVIIAQNEVSLESCEDMLAALAKAKTSIEVVAEKKAFRVALGKAENNITEMQEPATIDKISRYYQAAFKGEDLALERTIMAIAELGEINRDAMRRADVRAQQLGYAGAWGVVFMATFSFMVGMIFLRSLRKNLIEPMHEIDAVAAAFRAGERMRRCSMRNPTRSTKQVLSNVNELLDMNNSYQNNDL
jgi:hypothetical protein